MKFSGKTENERRLKNKPLFTTFRRKREESEILHTSQGALMLALNEAPVARIDRGPGVGKN